MHCVLIGHGLGQPILAAVQVESTWFLVDKFAPIPKHYGHGVCVVPLCEWVDGLVLFHCSVGVCWCGLL